MMRQDQSSPATDHRFSRIIGCSAFAPRKGEPSEPSVNPRKGAWVHRFPSPFQCFAPVVNPVNPYSPNKTLGDDTAAAGQRRGSLGRRHVSGGNIGKVGSLGSLGSPSDTSDHRFPLFLLPISPACFSNGQENAGHGGHGASGRHARRCASHAIRSSLSADLERVLPMGHPARGHGPPKKHPLQNFSIGEASQCYSITLTSRTFWGLNRASPPRIISGPLRGLPLFRPPLPPEPAESLPAMK